MNNENRQGKFTSSQMYRLVGTPAVKKTYIEETKIERRMKRCLDVGSYSQSMAWGKFMEWRVFKILGLEYKIVSKQTLLHEHYPDFWSGSPDMIAFKGDTAEFVAEVKCYYPKGFAELTDAMLLCKKTQTLDALKAINKGKEYWQIVSNAILCGVDVGELITYMPYEDEMPEIIEEVENFEGEDLWQFRFITERGNDVLPVLPNDGYYKNLNKFRFQIPEQDINYLTNAVLEASKLL